MTVRGNRSLFRRVVAYGLRVQNCRVPGCQGGCRPPPTTGRRGKRVRRSFWLAHRRSLMSCHVPSSPGRRGRVDSDVPGPQGGDPNRGLDSLHHTLSWARPCADRTHQRGICGAYVQARRDALFMALGDQVLEDLRSYDDPISVSPCERDDEADFSEGSSSAADIRNGGGA